MRVVGYVRESPGPDTGENAYVQSETVRRWVAHHGFHLVGLCQDVRPDDGARHGFGSLLGVIASRRAELVVVPSLSALSADKVTQEVMLFELRCTGVAVASAAEADLEALSDATTDMARLFIRDTLEKAERYRRDFSQQSVATTSWNSVAAEGLPVDVIVEMVAEAEVPDLVARRALRRATA